MCRGARHGIARDADRSVGMSSAADAELRALLLRVRRVAVVGIKADASEDSHRVALYLQQRGYRILPVNPGVVSVLGEVSRPWLGAIDEPIDLVDVFRAPRHLPAHAEEILGLAPRPLAVWFQLGIRDDGVAARLEAAGIRVLQDCCLMVEHRRLLGDSRDQGAIVARTR